ncbi:hypothetical protein V6x_54130 [Gimesia chilikensis]|uniref:Uncharacterized protein n=1 Tax=Gimesia chilikensis TaxID=2605989 RepID=A0A517WK87_9PLAN|nr:hypothetical protein V6x_54130 [Gimesia chilikensis]
MCCFSEIVGNELGYTACSMILSKTITKCRFRRLRVAPRNFRERVWLIIGKLFLSYEYNGISKAVFLRLECEMESISRDFKQITDRLGKNIFSLVILIGYLIKHSTMSEFSGILQLTTSNRWTNFKSCQN